MPVPTAVPPCASASRRGKVLVQARASILHLRAPAGELLPERYGHRIHEMRASGLHDRADFSLLAQQNCARYAASAGMSVRSTASAALT